MSRHAVNGTTGRTGVPTLPQNFVYIYMKYSLFSANFHRIEILARTGNESSRAKTTRVTAAAAVPLRKGTTDNKWIVIVTTDH